MIYLMNRGAGPTKNPRRVLAIAAAASLVLLVPLASTNASMGDLDATFGVGGKVATRILFESRPFSVALQPDGKIVAAGSVSGGPGSPSNIAVVRYNSDGALDTSFGSGGVVTNSHVGSYAVPVAIQRDGKIIVAGTAVPNNTPDFAVLRYSVDGSPDTSFGIGGAVTTDFFERYDSPAAIALQPDGRIIVAGTTFTDFAGRYQLALARYNNDGSLDASFGAGGKVTSSPAEPYYLSSIALQPDGKILAVGSLLVRYNADGSLDAGFGNGGKIVADFGPPDFGLFGRPSAIAVQPDGRIVVAGTITNAQGSVGPSSIALACYNSDGSLDTSFGKGGKVISAVLKHEQTRALALQTDGKIVLVGDSSSTGYPDGRLDTDFLLARYNSNGSLDTGFGADGRLTTDFGRSETGRALAIQTDGKIVVVGFSGDPSFDEPGWTNGQTDFVLARYVGTPPPDFGLSSNSTTVNASRASKLKLTINVDRISGFTGNVTVTAPDTSALKIQVKESSVSTTGPSVDFVLKIKKGASVGSHELRFMGRDDSGRERSVTVILVVQ